MALGIAATIHIGDLGPNLPGQGFTMCANHQVNFGFVNIFNPGAIDNLTGREAFLVPR